MVLVLVRTIVHNRVTSCELPNVPKMAVLIVESCTMYHDSSPDINKFVALEISLARIVWLRTAQVWFGQIPVMSTQT